MILKKMKKKNIFLLLIFLFADIYCFSQEVNEQKPLFTEKQRKMKLGAENIRLFPHKNDAGKITGFDLYVQKIDGIESILLTETTKDPDGKSDSYAYRAMEYNSVNGDEIRFLDGKPLVSEGSRYSLIDSTAEKTDFFEAAFHIYIPSVIQYGYEWTRNAVIQIDKGTFINIRTFEKPYADYSGDYMDSPFVFDFAVTKPVPVVEEKVELLANYNPAAGQKFAEFSEYVIYSKGPESIVSDILSALEQFDEDKLDVVFAIDATGSMKNDIEQLKKDLMNSLKEKYYNKTDYKYGLLFYRDYGDTFKYKDLPVKIFNFTDNLESFNKNLNSVKIFGTEGGDIPEAVYEALYASSEWFSWRADSKKCIVLVGDAEPHPKPRGIGKYSEEYVINLIKAKNISLKAILLPSD